MDVLCLRLILICAIIAATTANTTVISSSVSTTPTTQTQVSGISSDTPTPVSVTTVSNDVNSSMTTLSVSNGSISVSAGASSIPSLASTTTGQSTSVSETTATVSSSSRVFNSTSPLSSTLRSTSGTTEFPTTTTSTTLSVLTTILGSSILTSIPQSYLTSTTTSPPTSFAFTTSRTTTSLEPTTSPVYETTDPTPDGVTATGISSSEVFNSTLPLSSTLRTEANPSSSTKLPASTTSTSLSFPTTVSASSELTSTLPSYLTSTTTSPSTSLAFTTTSRTTASAESSTSSAYETTDPTPDSTTTTVISSSEIFNSTIPLSSTLRTEANPSSTTKLPTSTTSTTLSFPTTVFASSELTSTPQSYLTSTTTSPPTSLAFTTTSWTTASSESSTSSAYETTDPTPDGTTTTVISSSEVFNSTLPLSSTLRTEANPSSTTKLPTSTTSTTLSFPTTVSASSIFTSTTPPSITLNTTSPPTSSALPTTTTATTTIPFESSTSPTSEETDYISENTTVSEVLNSTTPLSSTLTTGELETTSASSNTTTTVATTPFHTTFSDTTQTPSPSSSTLKTSTTSTTAKHTTSVQDCGEPPHLENGNVLKNGSVATYYCKPGYLGRNASIKCLPNGIWEPLSVTCSPVDCGKLTPYSNASITYFPKNTSYYGSVAVLRCNTGYTISNTSKSTTFRCNESASWDGNRSVTCETINCKKLDPPNNGKLSTYNTTVNSFVIYMCNVGYTLKGFQSRVCLDSGEWSRIPPTCNKDPEKPVKQCPINTDSRKVQWNETKAGQSISIPCSLHNTNLSGEITRDCTREGEWLLPNYNCTRKEIENIKNAVNEIKETPSESTVEDVLGTLSNLTNQSTNETAYAGEIQAITESLQVIADINYTNINLTEKQSKAFLETTSNLLDPSNAESWQSIDQESGDKEEVSGASKMLNVVSKYTDAISSSLNDTHPNQTILTANLILEVRRLNNSEDITFPDENDKVNASSSLVLSKDALKGSTKYSAIIYKNLTGVLSTKAYSDSEDLELGSSVLSVKLDNWQSNDFRIKMTFQNFKQNDLEPKCSFRNESRNYWGTAGCERKSFNSSMTTCECDHLTNFAILMSPWTEENVETKAIRIVSIIGCSVSVLCLLLTILAHICYWRYVKSDRVKILMNLCIALLFSYGLFLGGVDRTSNKDVCTTMAVLLQYIYLVVFFLMLAEGIEISVVVLYVFLTRSRLKWILPCAWLIPAIIVGISLAVTQTKGYGNSEFCWLSVDNGLIWAFVGPALLIILVNFVLLVLILKTIYKTKNLAQKSNKQRAMAGIRCLCVLLPLVGCTWVIGIFYVNESMVWIQYIFAVCNSLQGLAIFIFHCALNTQLKQAFQRRRKLSESASYTRSTSNALKLVPRARLSQTASDLYCSIGTETPFQHGVSSFETYEY